MWTFGTNECLSMQSMLFVYFILFSLLGLDWKIGCWTGYFSNASEKYCQTELSEKSNQVIWIFIIHIHGGNDSSSRIFSNITQYCVCSLTRMWHDFHHYFHHKAITTHKQSHSPSPYKLRITTLAQTKVIIISATIEYQLLSQNGPFYWGFIICDLGRSLSRLGFYRPSPR